MHKKNGHKFVKFNRKYTIYCPTGECKLNLDFKSKYNTTYEYIKTHCKRCPQCDILFEHDGGCPYMRCTRCGFSFNMKNALEPNLRNIQVNDFGSDTFILDETNLIQRIWARFM